MILASGGPQDDSKTAPSGVLRASWALLDRSRTVFKERWVLVSIFGPFLGPSWAPGGPATLVAGRGVAWGGGIKGGSLQLNYIKKL